MAHPWSYDVICKAAIMQCWTAVLRQLRKRAKYEKQAMSTEERCTKLVPSVIKRFGLWDMRRHTIIGKSLLNNHDPLRMEGCA